MSNKQSKKIITPVVFRKYKDSKGSPNEIIALFPYDIELNDGCCSCYMHVGQHGAANYNGVIASTQPATEEEYADLKKELENYQPEPYHLRVITKRSTPKYFIEYQKYWSNKYDKMTK